MNRNIRSVLPLAFGAVTLFAASHARAAVPADYLGKPYKGTPSVIPGRVDLANLDTGGAEVSYHADHNRMNSAGYEPISGNDYRPDEHDLPNICKTNGVNPDVWADDNTTYPSEADKYWYYMGYAHAVDWVKLTVDVKAAGKYYVSSYWASAGDMWGLSIWFNDGTGTPDPQRPKDGINKTGLIEMAGTSDYHKWKKYPNFATVDLSAGLQVMTFHLEKHDHLQYGFLQFDPVDGTTGLGGTGGTGAGGTSAGGSSSSTGGVATTAGVTGADPGAGSTSLSGSATGGSASAGTSSTTLSGSSAGGGSSTPGLGNSGANTNQDSSCSIGHSDRRWPAALGLLLAGCALLRRARKTNH